VTQAQNTKYNARALEEHQRDHALFMAFAPVSNPKIALAVIVENAGWGAGAAAPIARRVFDYVLMDQYPSEADMAAIRIGKAGAPIGKPRVASEVAWPAATAAAPAP
jgi:penicillin-binding protein 2